MGIGKSDADKRIEWAKLTAAIPHTVSLEVPLRHELKALVDSTIAYSSGKTAGKMYMKQTGGIGAGLAGQAAHEPLVLHLVEERTKWGKKIFEVMTIGSELSLVYSTREISALRRALGEEFENAKVTWDCTDKGECGEVTDLEVILERVRDFRERLVWAASCDKLHISNEDRDLVNK
jgi:hypothetical protein